MKSSDGRQKESRLKVGTIIEDRFEIVELLGVGGFGAVYRARQLVFGNVLREVALKLFDSDKVSSTNMYEVFNDGIRLISLQESDSRKEIFPYLIQVYDMGVIKTPEPKAFMSMKLIPGRRSLQTLVRKFSGGLMPVETSLHFLRQMLIPLAWMHTLESPVVHGDLHPGNILLTEESELVLVDFGLAARLPLGTLGGAIGYQAPETLLRQPGIPSADVYGIGVIWYEMLTGRPPFNDVGLEAAAGDDFRALVHAHSAARKWPIRPLEPGEEFAKAQRIQPASEVNEQLLKHPQLEAVLNQCFAWKSTERFSNAQVLLNEIDRYIQTNRCEMAIVPQVKRPAEEPVLAERTSTLLVEDSNTLRLQGRHKEALETAKAALDKEKTSVPALLAKAKALVTLKQLDAAMQTINQAQKIAPQDPDLFETLAEVHLANGRSGLADSLRKQAITLRSRTLQSKKQSH